jgi:RNA 3'-terminal phosphate cyclase-like protein
LKVKGLKLRPAKSFLIVFISFLGTSLLYHPGLLIGGKIEHECNLQRSIGYFLEVLMCLAPFCKKPLHAVLTGITNDQVDPSVCIYLKMITK